MPSEERQQSLPGLDPDGPEIRTPKEKNAGGRAAGTQPSGSKSPSSGNQGESSWGKDSESLRKEARQQLADAESLRGKTVYVLDAFGLIFQVFHGLPEMTSPRGESVGAVYGFTRDILFLLEQKQPDFLICAFDLPGPTFRNELFDQYKANREAMPEQLVPQIPKTRQILEAFSIPILDHQNYEADDVMATIARKCNELEMECYLVTSDKDCRQLISEYVKLYNVRKDLVYNEESLLADWGIRPDQVVDFQALVGDKTDNVSGVPLIGPKIAGELLSTYNSLDQVLEHAAEVKGKKRSQNLIDYREDAILSRTLVRLDENVPILVDWNASRVGDIDYNAATELFNEFGFRSFGQRLADLDVKKAPKMWEADYQVVRDLDELTRLVQQMSEQTLISVDTETTSLHPRLAEIVGYSFAWEEGRGYYVPVRAPAGDTCLDPDQAKEILRPVLENPAIEKLGQNLKYDLVVLRTAGIEMQGVAFDTMIASYLLDAGERNHNLDELSRRYLNHTPVPISSLIGKGKDQKRMDEVAVADVGYYAAEDADIPLRLEPILDSRLEELELGDLFSKVEIPLVEVLAELEYNGIRLDVGLLARQSRRYAERMESLEAEIYALAETEFNIASPKQLAEVLFVQHGLPVIKKTKTGFSTDADVLAQLARIHDLPAKIIEFRQIAKLKSTYVDALPALVHPQTGRIHTSFNQVVTATGRLSSSDPNLQNIPIRTEQGREIRAAFLPERGWKLLAADYSQVELRVLAHFSQDEALCAAFEADQDIHRSVAAEVYSVASDQVTPEMRRAAKAVNFGIIYGQSPFGLANALDIEQEEAASFIDSYFARYPGVENFLAKTLEDCRLKGYVKTVLGRRRAIRGVRSEAGRNRNLAERTAINTVIQGSAADLIKLAMISIYERLRNESLSARMLLQIHDELIFEVPPDELDGLGKLVAEEMAHVLELSVPLKIDLKSGDNWSDCEPM